MTALPPEPAPEPAAESIRIFVSYAHGAPGQGLGFGAVMLDIEFEPFTIEHVIGVQQLIESAGAQRVTVLHWQRVEVRA